MGKIVENVTVALVQHTTIVVCTQLKSITGHFCCCVDKCNRKEIQHSTLQSYSTYQRFNGFNKFQQFIDEEKGKSTIKGCVGD